LGIWNWTCGRFICSPRHQRRKPRSERRLHELLQERPKATGTLRRGGKIPPRDNVSTYAEQGIDKDLAKRVRSERRDLTKAQRAIGLAMLYPEPKRGMHSQSGKMTEKMGISKACASPDSPHRSD
jgi:hypothetical protein